ncbi:MAG TPA: metallophosphoesterase family protein, partial [Usitatibacter sp.]|nr:metallophosphoesterase family protein [Usitatibacter sp.]
MARYGLLGDIHGNREALEAALACLDACEVDRIACVGDLVGYNADGDACVALLRSRDTICIAGNHDLIGTGKLGFERCSNKAMHALKRTRRTLGSDTSEYLRSLPSHARIGGVTLLTHGGVRDVQQYMTRPAHILENIDYLRRDFPGRRICFFGHTHEQKVFEIDGASVNEVA